MFSFLSVTNKCVKQSPEEDDSGYHNQEIALLFKEPCVPLLSSQRTGVENRSDLHEGSSRLEDFF
jgi:hypothetical protein